MMRVRWWLVFVLGGVVLAVVVLTLLSSTAQFLVFCLGVVFSGVALLRLVRGQDYSREWPVPPGFGGPFWGGGPGRPAGGLRTRAADPAASWVVLPTSDRGLEPGVRRRASNRPHRNALQRSRGLTSHDPAQ
jgi:hypothetical protein